MIYVPSDYSMSYTLARLRKKGNDSVIPFSFTTSELA